MRFEDLDVWKRSARLSAEIYKQFNNHKDFSYRDQLTRSGLSIPSNIAEGFERESDKECINFLAYAKSSCGELRTQIYIGKEIGYLSDSVANKWIRESQEISSMLAGLIKTKRGFVNREG